MPGKLQLDVDYFLVGIFPALLGFERSMPSTELVAENAHTPHIHHLVVVLPSDDFGRDVV